MSIGKAVKNIRKDKKLNQAEFAAYIDVPLGTYRNWEQDLRDPETPRLIELAEKLNVSTDYLLGRNPMEYVQAASTGIDIKDLPPEARSELDSYVEYLSIKWGKKDPGLSDK